MQKAVLDWTLIRTLAAAPMPLERSILAKSRVIGRSGKYVVFYGPFSSVPNAAAEVAFVGVTPGYSQLVAATRTASQVTALSKAQRALAMRRKVAFAGPMRHNLIAMLDELGLHRRLHLGSTADLFAESASRMFATSALRYPVFCDGIRGLKNYSGDGAILREPLFLEMIHALLEPTLAKMPGALIVPLGKWAEAVVCLLAKERALDQGRVLRGFPHPSGGNGHRQTIFQANRASLRRQITHWFS